MYVKPNRHRFQKFLVSVVSELLGVGRIKFHEGKLEEFKRLSAQAMEICAPPTPVHGSTTSS